MRPSRSTSSDGQLADLAAIAHHDNALGEPEYLFELGRDEDDRQTLLRQLGDLALDVGLRADVDAAGRLVEDDELRARSRASARAAPSAGCRRRGCAAGRFGSAGRTSRAFMYSATTASCSLRRMRRIHPRRAWMPSTMFCATVRSPMTPSPRRSSDENTMRLSIARAGRGHPDGLAVDLDLPGVGAVGAVQQPHEFGAPGAEQAGDADDLALVDVDVGGLEHAAAPDAGRAQHRGAGAVDRRARSSTRWRRARRARGRSSS